MTEVDFKHALYLLQYVQRWSGPERDKPVSVDSFVRIVDDMEGQSVGTVLVAALSDRGLLMECPGDRWLTTSGCDLLLDQVSQDAVEHIHNFKYCPYTFAHTRHWCGNDFCRES